MLIECSECKHRVAETATKCPQCGHVLLAGERKKIGIIGLVFAASPILIVLLFRSFQISGPPGFEWMMAALVLIGAAMTIQSRFHKKKPKA